MDPQSLAIWLTVSATFNLMLAGVIAIGSIWSAFREIHIRDERTKSTTALNNVAAGYRKLIMVGDMITNRITEMNNLSQQDRRELLDFLRDFKHEQVDLLTDIEKRITREFDRENREKTGASVNVHGGLNNIGQTDVRGNQVL